MKSLKSIPTFIAVSLLLVGCMTYKYAGQTFQSEQEALAYEDRHLGEGVAKLEPASERVGGALKIYYPNQEIFRSRMITGNQQGAAADYLVKVAFADVRHLKDAFEHRKSFDTVELVFSQGEHRKPEASNYVLYFYAESAQIGSWYFVGTRVPKSAVGYDRGTSDMSARYRGFTESVESLAMAEKLATKH